MRSERSRSAAKPAPAAPRRLTNIEKIRLVNETIEREIRPKLKRDGGDIELVDVVGTHVVVALRGMCANCKVSQFTLKDVVEKTLQEFVSGDLVVEEERQ